MAEVEDMMRGLSLVQISAIQNKERDVAASHGFSGVWAIKWDVHKTKTAKSGVCQKLI